MNVASLELCKELKELSKWGGTDFHYGRNPMVSKDWDLMPTKEALEIQRQNISWEFIPAYDLGYLLRKLQAIDDPDNGIKENIYVNLSVSKGYSNAYSQRGITDTGASQPNQRQLPSCGANTPEDAACKLAIGLFKQGILKS